MYLQFAYEANPTVTVACAGVIFIHSNVLTAFPAGRE